MSYGLRVHSTATGHAGTHLPLSANAKATASNTMPLPPVALAAKPKAPVKAKATKAAAGTMPLPRGFLGGSR